MLKPPIVNRIMRKENLNMDRSKLTDHNNEVGFDALVIQYLAGIDLVGHNVEVWQDSKRGAFKKNGTVIKYRKSKSKKRTNNYLVRFKGTYKQGEFFDIWMPRNMLYQLD